MYLESKQYDQSKEARNVMTLVIDGFPTEPTKHTTTGLRKMNSSLP